MSKQSVLSGIQPTGNLHFGRYFGAIQNWVKLQEKYECKYSIVDYHAMTMPWSPKKLREQSWELAINLIACGIKPENLFIQSMIPEHAELFWIMNCMCGYGELGRMTQFKDKSQQASQKDKDAVISSALYTYPVLQAADILIYHAGFVPVGKDQEQHLELTRNLASRFNHIIGKEYFTLPEPLFTEIPKVMSTADPTRKMSASAGEKHNIDIFADPKRIAKQIKSAVTDSGEPSEEMSAGLANLFRLLKASGNNEAHDELFSSYEKSELRYGDLKGVLAASLVDMTEPLRERKANLLANKKEVKQMVKDSSSAIRKIAQNTLKEVKDLVGLMNTAS